MTAETQMMSSHEQPRYWLLDRLSVARQMVSGAKEKAAQHRRDADDMDAEATEFEAVVARYEAALKILKAYEDATA